MESRKNGAAGKEHGREKTQAPVPVLLNGPEELNLAAKRKKYADFCCLVGGLV